MPKKSKLNKKQKELLVVVLFSILLGLGGGYVLGSTLGSENGDSNSEVANSEKMQPHSHDKLYEVDGENAPTVELVAKEDAKSGYNIKIVTSNFTFNPDGVNGDNASNEGHAHLYVDGEKISRVYSHDFHYNVNFEGTKEFKVSLNANDHSQYAIDGKPIEASVMVSHDSEDPEHDSKHTDESSMPAHSH